MVSGIAGLILSVAGVSLFARAAEQIGRPYWMRFAFDTRVFAVLAAVCLASALVFGLLPALSLSGGAEGLGGRGTTAGLRRRRWAAWSVTAEVALSLVLLFGAAVMTRSFLALYRADAVLDTSQLIVLQVSLPSARYPTPDQRMAVFDRLEEQLKTVPGVLSLTTASMVPFNGSFPRDLAIEGRANSPDQPPPRVPTVVVGARYFETVGLPLTHGRGFTGQDGAPGHESVIINEQFRRTFFPSEDPVGRRIRLVAANNRGAAPAWLTIVGVSPTVRQRTDGPTPVAYIPHRAEPLRAGSLIIRTAAGVGIAVSLRQQAQAVAPDLPLYGLATLDDVLSQSRFVQRVFGLLFTIFATIGLVLAAVGMYAVIASEVASRSVELGIRMALGASASAVRGLILRAMAVRFSVGLAIGLVAAALCAPVLQSVVQTGARDATTLGAVGALLLFVSLVASLLAVGRIARIDPGSALRRE
jgi:predicted permease